jgi:hypothetical protein
MSCNVAMQRSDIHQRVFEELWSLDIAPNLSGSEYTGSHGNRKNPQPRND